MLRRLSPWKQKIMRAQIKLNNEVRNAAYAKGINRVVNIVNARKILADMKTHGYRQAELVQVMPAEKAIENGDITLIDIEGNEINAEDAVNYYLVLDGQHRIKAVALYNEEAKKNEKEEIQVPAILVELGEQETIAEYISAVNITKIPWKTDDYVRGAANVKQNSLLTKYKELLKTEENKNGYPLSTLNLIFCSNSKAINKTGLSLLCQGKDTKTVGKVEKSIIPPHNIERGDRFIALCKSKGFSNKDIAKRYLAERFASYHIEKDSEKGFKVFDAITENDRQAMYNDKKNLSETNVIEQFKKIAARLEEQPQEE